MLPFTVNSLAQAAAVASLAAESELLERVELVVKERDRVRHELLGQGWTVPPTEANFVWLPLGERSAEFSDHCDAAGRQRPAVRTRRRPGDDRRPRGQRRVPRRGGQLPAPGLASVPFQDGNGAACISALPGGWRRLL